jgi:septum formation protein
VGESAQDTGASRSPQLVLASRSPRRRELLAQCGLCFHVVDVEIEERPARGEPAADYACRVALDKARAGAAQVGDTLPVLGADTDVVLDGEILGKPHDRAHALELLARLSGRRHQVCSAVAVVHAGRESVQLSVTDVSFGPISPQQAAAYWASGEPAGKAGAYAIQGLGAVFVREIRGSYSGVVGLPLFETAVLLSECGVEVLLPRAL